MGAGMSAVRGASFSPFYRVGGGSGAANGGGINAGRSVWWGGETEGRVGSEEGGGVQRRFRERRGCRGGACAC
jgi:hypothetical protein